MYTPLKAGVKASENENKLIFDRLKSKLQLSNTLKINKNQKKMFFGKLDFPIFGVFPKMRFWIFFLSGSESALFILKKNSNTKIIFWAILKLY